MRRVSLVVLLIAALDVPLTSSMTVRAIPLSMSAYLVKKLTIATSAPTSKAASHVETLVADAPPDIETSQLAVWVHAQFDLALRAIEKEPEVARALAAGEITLRNAVEVNMAYSAAASAMYQTINGHHRELRAVAAEVAAQSDESGDEEAAAAGAGTSESDAWRRGTADDDALRAYAAAATQIGSREWVRMGIEWMVRQATDFFDGPPDTGEPQLANLAKRAANACAYATRGGPLTAPEEAALRAALRAERAAIPRVRLLDVGACGTLFDAHAAVVDATAIDLCPQEGNACVAQCDFLELAISSAGSAPAILPSDEWAGGTVSSLPAEGYDAVALSLVLSYLPKPRLRGAMIRKARRLLPTPDPPCVPPPAMLMAAGEEEKEKEAEKEKEKEAAGAGAEAEAEGGASRGPSATTTGRVRPPRLSRGLLLVVDTFSLDGRHASRNKGYIKEWIEAIESEGFVFLRHQVLKRSHALAFATAPRKRSPSQDAHADEAGRRLEAREPPELRMRREERSDDWDEGLACQQAGRTEAP